eukprot:6964311-Pyramimonas_sp.AAC.1
MRKEREWFPLSVSCGTEPSTSTRVCSRAALSPAVSATLSLNVYSPSGRRLTSRLRLISEAPSAVSAAAAAAARSASCGPFRQSPLCIVNTRP